MGKYFFIICYIIGKHFKDILVVSAICLLAILFFNSCRAKKEILETHIESRDSVCNIKESQNIVLMHEDSVHTTSSVDLTKVDTSKECVVKFNNIETRDTNGTVSYDKSVIIYGKKNSIYVDVDKITDKSSVVKDSSSASIDSVATTEQHIDSIDQNEQKTDKGWNTWHTFLFWIIIVLCLSVGIVESNRKK